MTKRLLPLLAVICLLLPGFSHAVVLERLYEASVPVADQSVTARQDAMRRALGIVLVRATGQRAAPQVAALADLVQAAPRLVQQFQFEQREVLDAETGSPRMTLHLLARFDPVAIQRELIQRGVPVWGRERPATLVWIAFDDGSDRGIAGASAAPVFQRAIDEAAAIRGLPIIWPLMDLEDFREISFADVWGGFEDRIMAASARYQPNAVLVGRIHRVDESRWAARWMSIEDGYVRHTETVAGLLPSTLSEGVSWIADAFGARFALMPDAMRDGRMRLTVTGVDGLAPYMEIMRYLEGLSPVASIALAAVDGDAVTFALELRGTGVQLQQAIALGGRLSPLMDEGGFELVSLRYRLRP